MRTFILLGVLGAIVGLAFLVARPSREPPAATPYVGVRGASRVKDAGLAITIWRGGESRALAPGTSVRAGDVLRFSVRAEHARYLLVRMRDGAGPARTIYPEGDVAPPPARPGQVLPAAPVVGEGGGKIVVTAVFADLPFPLEDARAANAQSVDVVIEKEPTP